MTPQRKGNKKTNGSVNAGGLLRGVQVEDREWREVENGCRPTFRSEIGVRGLGLDESWHATHVVLVPHWCDMGPALILLQSRTRMLVRTYSTSAVPV